MPGLVGILKKQDNTFDVEQLLSRMCQVIKYEDWYKIDTFLEGSFGIGRVNLGILNPEPQPIFNEDRSLCIMMEGEIYDYQDLKEELISKGHKFLINNDPEFILHLFEEYGKDFIHKLNGSFILAIWNNKKQELLIVNDRYGLRPLYYTKHNGYLLFSSEVKAILEDNTFKKVVDDRAVADFFAFGHILGTKTFFRGIYFLPSASIMTCQTDRISIKSYDLLDIKEDKEYPQEYYIKSLSKLLLQAVERQMKGNKRMGVSLSGGFDSRAIIAAIDKKHYPIYAHTWGEHNCNDVCFANMVASRLGIKHHFSQYTPHDIIANVEKAVFITDGMFNCIHSHGIATLQKVRVHCDVILSGFASGEILGGDQPHQVLTATDEKQFIDVVYRQKKGGVSEEILNSLFENSYREKIKNMPYESIKQCLGNYKNGSYSTRCELFALREGTLSRFGIYGLVIARSQLEYRTPFYDNDLMDFILRIPGEYKQKHKIYRKMMLTLFPFLCDIPTDRKGLPINANYWQKIRQKMKSLFKAGLAKYFGVSFKSNYFADYHRWMQASGELQKYVRDILLGPKVKSRHYFKREVVQKILHEEFTGRKNNVELIWRLMTFELWNRLFIDKEKLKEEI